MWLRAALSGYTAACDGETVLSMAATSGALSTSRFSPIDMGRLNERAEWPFLADKSQSFRLSKLLRPGTVPDR